jgi:hypothetical protein
MKTVSMGTKKKQYASIKMMAVETGIPYMTLYMRLRMGTKPAEAAKKPVRKYERKEPLSTPNQN